MSSSILDRLSRATPTQLAIAAVLAVPVFLILRVGYTSSVLSRASAPLEPDETENKLNASKSADSSKGEEKKSIMQGEVEGLTRDDKPFTQADLKPFDGSVPGNPIYVSIKGTVFDVTRKADVYGAGKSYNIFAGKDGSKGLGMSSLKDEHAIPDFSDLPPAERKVLDDWYAFFSKRYNVAGYVVDMPDAVKHECDSPDKAARL